MLSSRYIISSAKVPRLHGAAYWESYKSGLSVWLEVLEWATDDVVEPPPAYIVYHRDFLERGWGWQRLVPYYPEMVDWSTLKSYLKEYSSQNAGEVAALCANMKPYKDKDFFRRNAEEIAARFADKYSDQVGLRISSQNYDMLAAAVLCIDIENGYRGAYSSHLTDEDMRLSFKIEERAKHVIQSVGEYSSAAAALVCIMKETELLYDLFEHEIDFSKVIKLCKIVRQNAYNLIFYKGPDSAAVAGALVGMEKEAKFMCYLLSQQVPDCVDFPMYEMFREKASTVLSRFVEEFLCGTPGKGAINGTPASANSDKPVGVGTVGYMNRKQSDSIEPSKNGINGYCVKDNMTKAEVTLVVNKGEELEVEGKTLQTSKKDLLMDARDVEEFLRGTPGSGAGNGTTASANSDQPMCLGTVGYLNRKQSDSLEPSKNDMNGYCVKDNKTKTEVKA